jgi:hypothetical protein
VSVVLLASAHAREEVHYRRGTPRGAAENRDLRPGRHLDDRPETEDVRDGRHGQRRRWGLTHPGEGAHPVHERGARREVAGSHPAPHGRSRRHLRSRGSGTHQQLVDGAVHGPPYYAVEGICRSATENWVGIDGTCALAGFDPLDLAPERFCNLVEVWFASRLEEAKYKALRDRWYRPPPEVVSPITREPDPEVVRQVEAQEGAAFSAFLGAHQQTQSQVGGG